MKLPPWSPELSLDLMSRNNTATTILSLSAPAVNFVREEAEAVSLCREINVYAAALRDARPSKFGFFATLPSLHYVSSALAEIAYAFDVLKADGVTLLTTYGKEYLGCPQFRPIWDELNRREAVVFIHPSMNLNGATALENPHVPQPLIDFPHETTRAAIHLIVSNTVQDHPQCKIILSHGGGTLPYVATRVAHMAEDGAFAAKSAKDFLEEARSFYFDLALTAYDFPLDLLRKFAKPGHILYGSDFPFAREKTSGPQAKFLDGLAAQMAEEEDFSMRRGAALELFPRLKIL